ncbi:MAG: DNA-formamidopyrimidine glycosylase family protein [Planctomycetota bacterium]
MPELPEVETVRASLEARVLGCTVSGVIVRRRDVIATPDDPPGGFGRQRRPVRSKARAPRRVEKADLLMGDTIDAVVRHGKQLALGGVSGRCVLIHLGMTGEVMAPGPGARLRAADHLHVLWTLRDRHGASAGRMVFRDPRRFGGVWTLPTRAELDDRWRALGPDGLVVTGNDLRERAGRSSRAIKAALLDQRVVAGVGNIYADEGLFRARLHPETPANRLSGGDWDGLAAELRTLLARAVELRGSTLRDYRDADGNIGDASRLHQVYGRAGLACNSCGSELRSIAVAQRTTVVCPRCQAISLD